MLKYVALILLIWQAHSMLNRIRSQRKIIATVLYNPFLDTIQQCVDSLEKQEKLDEIQVWYRDEKPVLRPSNRVKVYHAREDYGASTNLLGTLAGESHPDTVIVTVHPYSTFEPNMVDRLLERMKNETKSIPCFGCEYYVHDSIKIESVSEGQCLGWPTTTNGVAFKREWFGSEIFDFVGINQACFIHDEMWIAGHLARREIYPSVIPNNAVHGSLEFNYDIGLCLAL
ncbi:hypothetical protein EDD86DRAFT_277584 [Gorgonomyces haynaldii]|nr:hypothetical protein EDD86DRAFT_277584 [Gorgonomyces haynaldii]